MSLKSAYGRRRTQMLFSVSAIGFPSWHGQKIGQGDGLGRTHGAILKIILVIGFTPENVEGDCCAESLRLLDVDLLLYFTFAGGVTIKTRII